MYTDIDHKKRLVLVAAIVAAVVVGFADVFVEEGSGRGRLLNVAVTIASGVLVLTWCHYDSIRTGYRFGSGFRLLIVIFGIFALLWYLARTRGLKQVWRPAGLALLFFIGLVVLSGLVSAVVGAMVNSFGEAAELAVAAESASRVWWVSAALIAQAR